MHHIDVTELIELEALAVSGVERPANGTEFVVMKSTEDTCEACGGSGQARHPMSGAFVMSPCLSCGGHGRRVDESNVMQRVVTKTTPPTKGTQMDTTILQKGANAVDAHATAYEAVAGDTRLPTHLRKQAGELASRLRLRAHISGQTPVVYADEAALGEQLEGSAEEYLQKAAVGNYLANVQSAQTDMTGMDGAGLPSPDLDTTRAQVLATQNRVTSPFAQPHNPRAQLASAQDDSYDRLAPAPEATQLDYRKEVHADIERLEKELAAATLPQEIGRISGDLTLAKLQALHAGGIDPTAGMRR